MVIACIFTNIVESTLAITDDRAEDLGYFEKGTFPIIDLVFYTTGGRADKGKALRYRFLW